MLFDQQPLTKLMFVHTGGLDAGEGVERALRLEALQPDLIQPFVDQPAAAVVALDHLLHILLARRVGERCQRRFLAHGWRRHDQVLVNLAHGADQVGGANGITDAPAGHGVILAHTAEVNRAFGHARQRREHDVMMTGVDQAVVNFVGNDDQVVLFGNARNFQQTAQIHDGAGWVAGEADQQRLGARGDGGADRLRTDLKIVAGIGGQIDDIAARQDHAGRVAHKAGLRHNHFVAGVKDRLHRQVHRLADADRDQHFLFDIVGDGAIATAQVVCHSFAQFIGAGVGGVGGVAVLQAPNAGLQNRRRRHKVRLADAQADDIFHRGGNVEVFADAGRRHGEHTLAEATGERAHRGAMTIDHAVVHAVVHTVGQDGRWDSERFHIETPFWRWK